MTDFRVFVTGSRDWPNRQTIRDALYGAATEAVLSGADALVVVHGYADGADADAHEWCDDNPAILFDGEILPVIEEIHRAAWKLQGRGAGFIRNQRMAKRLINRCLAFIHRNSKGASHALGCAEKAGVPSRVWRV